MACCKKARALRAKRLKESAKIQQLVKNPEWQTVRRSLVGVWLKQPEWGCEKLKEYLGKFSNTTEDKLNIVLNYLRSGGFGSGKIKHSCIQTLRSQISMELKKARAKKR
jgi:hypothetical protein